MEKEQNTQSADFYNQVLGSDKEKAYSEEEIKNKQQNWRTFNLKPQKPQLHDFPDYFFAGFWIRLLAFVIDMICIMALQNVLLNTVFNLTGWQKNEGLFTVYGFLSLLIYLSYFIFLTKLNHGQTLGKMIFGIQVISFDEEKLSWQTVLVREGACRFILKFPLLMWGYLPAAFTKKKQHAGDFLCNTSVVTISLIRAFNQQKNG